MEKVNILKRGAKFNWEMQHSDPDFVFEFLLVCAMLRHIRFATIMDAPLIAEMSRETFYETFAEYNTREDMDKFMNEQFTADALIKEVGTTGNIFILCYDDQTPVGYARLRESENPPELKDQKAIEIARIYALTREIGKGVGKTLIQKCIEIAQEKEREVIWLGVWEKNIRAIEFYTGWGFVKFGEHPFVLGNDVQTDWLMKKSI